VAELNNASISNIHYLLVQPRPVGKLEIRHLQLQYAQTICCHRGMF